MKSPDLSLASRRQGLASAVICADNLHPLLTGETKDASLGT